MVEISNSYEMPPTPILMKARELIELLRAINPSEHFNHVEHARSWQNDLRDRVSKLDELLTQVVKDPSLETVSGISVEYSSAAALVSDAVFRIPASFPPQTSAERSFEVELDRVRRDLKDHLLKEESVVFSAGVDQIVFQLRRVVKTYWFEGRPIPENFGQRDLNRIATEVENAAKARLQEEVARLEATEAFPHVPTPQTLSLVTETHGSSPWDQTHRIATPVGSIGEAVARLSFGNVPYGQTERYIAVHVNETGQVFPWNGEAFNLRT